MVNPAQNEFRSTPLSFTECMYICMMLNGLIHVLSCSQVYVLHIYVYLSRTKRHQHGFFGADKHFVPPVMLKQLVPSLQRQVEKAMIFFGTDTWFFTWHRHVGEFDVLVCSG